MRHVCILVHQRVPPGVPPGVPQVSPQVSPRCPPGVPRLERIGAEILLSTTNFPKDRYTHKNSDRRQ
jgi:hypothetical protein